MDIEQARFLNEYWLLRSQGRFKNLLNYIFKKDDRIKSFRGWRKRLINIIFGHDLN
jgi:hypothetical protein